ncbi:hypothetical protein BD779DRAFT_1468752 [Infundibulicybe gibba]|nr:hypothetical protein BD779DRAFT_1468752 [Infundibulicybe gibba]
MAVLLDVPADVLLQLVSYFDVQDAVSWSMVCTTLHALRRTPSFWLSTLKATLGTRPLACPTHENLVSHNLQTLRDIAMHTMRVQRSWGSPRPQCIESGFASIDLGAEHLLFCIPGTRFYVAHSKNRREITCWHYEKREVLSLLPCGRMIRDISQTQAEGPGKFSVALLTTGLVEDGGYGIRVLCVDYTPTHATLHYTFEHQLPDDFSYQGLFMTSETVGVIQPTTGRIFALNRTSHASTIVETDLAGSEGYSLYPKAATNRGRVFILNENNKRSHLFTCPTDLLLEECLVPNHTGSIKGGDYLQVHSWPSHITTDKIFTRGVCSTDSSYGVSAISVYAYGACTLARWWVTNPDGDSLAATDLVSIPGFSPYGVERFQASHFGLYLLLITQSLAHTNPHCSGWCNSTPSRGRLVSFSPRFQPPLI